jgi:RNA:NAD 2'-phosphotransferase (TPT1/KptA family)
MKGHKYNKYKEPNVKLSKKLAWLLRHNAEKEGLAISPDGYVLLDDVLNYLIGDGWKDINF